MLKFIDIFLTFNLYGPLVEIISGICYRKKCSKVLINSIFKSFFLALGIFVHLGIMHKISFGDDGERNDMYAWDCYEIYFFCCFFMALKTSYFCNEDFHEKRVNDMLERPNMLSLMKKLYPLKPQEDNKIA